MKASETKRIDIVDKAILRGFNNPSKDQSKTPRKRVKFYAFRNALLDKHNQISSRQAASNNYRHRWKERKTFQTSYMGMSRVNGTEQQQKRGRCV